MRAKAGEINYDVWGEGPPLVLIHANPFDNTLWLYQVAHFSTFFKVVSIDVRGYGRSSKPNTKFSMRDMTGDVVEVCRHLRIRKAVFGGISIGSSILQQLAVDHPEMIRALILAGTGYHPPNLPLDFAERNIAGYSSSGMRFREADMRRQVSGHFQRTELGEHLLSVHLERNPVMNAETLKNVFVAYKEWREPKEYRSVRFPVLLLVGQEDDALQRSIDLHRKIPKSEHVVIKGSGHACCLEKPGEFDAAVLSFLKKHKLLPSISR